MLGYNFPQFNNQEAMAKEAIRLDTYDHIKKAMKKYGIEGTEDIIKRVYENMPDTRDYLLRLYREILKG